MFCLFLVVSNTCDFCLSPKIRILLLVQNENVIHSYSCAVHQERVPQQKTKQN